MNLRFLAALFGALFCCLPAFAAQVTINSSSYTDLGVGPLQISSINGPVGVIYGSSPPSNGTRPDHFTHDGELIARVILHVYAVALGQGSISIGVDSIIFTGNFTSIQVAPTNSAPLITAPGAIELLQNSTVSASTITGSVGTPVGYSIGSAALKIPSGSTENLIAGYASYLENDAVSGTTTTSISLYESGSGKSLQPTPVSDYAAGTTLLGTCVLTTDS